MNRILTVAMMGLIVLGFDSLQSVPFSAQEPRELIVCPEGCSFTRIQEAIDAAQEGDTIKILAGTYKETLFISKGITLQGESAEQVIVEPTNPQDTVVTIRTVTGKTPSSGSDPIAVTLSGMTISGGQAGVEVTQAKARLINNRILDNADGIKAFGSAASALTLTLEGNRISGGGQKGIGVSLVGEFNTTLQHNTILDKVVGIMILGQVVGELQLNTISGNKHGLVIGSQAQALLEENQVVKNSIVGVQLSDKANVTISRNEIHENGYGIALWQQPCFPTNALFAGTIQGSENGISDNLRLDLCPFRYPWPENFIRGGS